MGRKSEQTEQLKKEVLTALEQTLGIVTPACKMAGIGRTTFYQWCKDDHEFNEKVKELNNHTLDFVESKLHKAIRDDNLTAVIIYLKSKGKGRGCHPQEGSMASVLKVKDGHNGIFDTLVQLPGLFYFHCPDLFPTLLNTTLLAGRPMGRWYAHLSRRAPTGNFCW